MTNKVNTIGEFNTSMGHIFTVEADRPFAVGQSIEANGKQYLIKGINMMYTKQTNVIGLIVADKAAS